MIAGALVLEAAFPDTPAGADGTEATASIEPIIPQMPQTSRSLIPVFMTTPSDFDLSGTS
jgi:hypothetical protein